MPPPLRERLDVVIVGAGVIGLAVARAFAAAGREVVVLESERAAGMHTSSRNSEVIHAGIHYPPGSLKARLCLAGRGALYEYCDGAGVPCARVGKLIVATRDDELPALDEIRRRAEACGVRDLTELGAAEARALEPHVIAVRALLSPSTGIVDSHALMRAFERDAVARGAQIVLATPVVSGAVGDGGVALEFGGAEPGIVRCRTVVNAAGLRAQAVASSIHGVPAASIPPCHYAKGQYFVLRGRSPFSRLVYPVPVPGGLGVHVTLDLAGAARFGPDVSWVDGIDYGFDASRAEAFYHYCQRLHQAARVRRCSGQPDGSWGWWQKGQRGSQRARKRAMARRAVMKESAKCRSGRDGDLTVGTAPSGRGGKSADALGYDEGVAT